MKKTLTASLFLLGFACLPAHADITVGVTVCATGSGASIGIAQKSIFSILPPNLGGEKARYIILDDASDPTNAVKNARKLIIEDNADVVIGSSCVPGSTAIVDVATELQTPQIALSPVGAPPAKLGWTFSIPAPAPIVMDAVAEHMRANGVKTVGYIGFNDPWGDLVYKSLAALLEPDGIKIIANERYARTDTSVNAQILKILSVNPDVVVVGGSGTPGALPQLTLVERGYKGRVYHNHGVIGKDFLRVAGKSAEGLMAPSGPAMVANYLPDSNPIKKVAQDFIKVYEGKFGPGSRTAFAADAYDAYLVLDNAVPVALKKARPGTAEFRHALRDALESTREFVGTQGVYNMTPKDHSGVDKRARLLLRVENGDWKPVK